MFEDYPAAHSMDTEWYAIDEDGHIAQFYSFDVGAIPVDFLDKFYEEGNVGNILIEAWLQKDEKGWIYLECDYNLIQEIITEKSESSKEPKPINDVEYAILLVVESEKVIDDLTFVDGIVYFNKEKTIFYIRECYSTDELEKAYQKGKIKSYADFYFDYKEVAKLLGFFIYEANSIEPYERIYSPKTSKKIEDMPESIRDKLSTVVFKGVKFRDYQNLQPPQHVKSRGWYSSWINYEGKLVKFEDYPNAQGIDTEWAAIDKDGHIAIFNTSQSGAVPIDFLNKFTSEDSVFDSIFINSNEITGKGWVHFYCSEEDYSLIGKKLETTAQSEELLQSPELANVRRLKEVFLIVESAEVISEIKSKGCIIWFDASKTIFYVEECSLKLLKRAHKKGKIKKMFLLNNIHEGRMNLPEFFGFFIYNSSPAYEALPYERIYSPSVPTKIKDVPEMFKARLSTVQFSGIKFKNSKRLQPPKHMKSKSVVSKWENYNGQIVDFEE